MISWYRNRINRNSILILCYERVGLDEELCDFEFNVLYEGDSATQRLLSLSYLESTNGNMRLRYDAVYGSISLCGISSAVEPWILNSGERQFEPDMPHCLERWVGFPEKMPILMEASFNYN